MTFFMTRLAPHTYALLRIVAGLMFLWHGTQKLFDFPIAGPENPPARLLVAAVIELVGGVLIMIGLLTRWTAFLCSGEMAVAYWTVHIHGGLFPIANGGELAVLYCFIFLFISAHGPGRWSVDGLWASSRAG